jgi:hypothetical protein
MPFTAPGILTADEVYAVTADILAEANIIDRTTVLDRQTLPRCKCRTATASFPIRVRNCSGERFTALGRAVAGCAGERCCRSTRQRMRLAATPQSPPPRGRRTRGTVGPFSGLLSDAGAALAPVLTQRTVMSWRRDKRHKSGCTGRSESCPRGDSPLPSNFSFGAWNLSVE